MIIRQELKYADSVRIKITISITKTKKNYAVLSQAEEK